MNTERRKNAEQVGGAGAVRRPIAKKVAILFDNFGPYHEARLRAGAKICDLLAVEVAASSFEYAWNGESRSRAFRYETLIKQGTSEEIDHHRLEQELEKTLSSFQPEVVIVPGWSSRASFAALNWSLRNNTPVVGVSQSTALDEIRSVWKEYLKRRIVRLFSAALVGGARQIEYLKTLGMPLDRIFSGYAAVDNHYFQLRAGEARKDELKLRESKRLPARYFLASARFVQKKNLVRLLEAYSTYRELVGKGSAEETQPDPWDLVLLGDGPLREQIERTIDRLGIKDHVRLPGFVQYQDLPLYFGLGDAFIHVSTSEQWGLVVNEAMASGLPVLASKHCGCVPNLVRQGVNGYAFDPYQTEEIADYMHRLSIVDRERLKTMGQASREIISQFDLEYFGLGVQNAVELALQVGPKRASLPDRILLKSLIYK
jgi:1,2-diacylglycerol 3-alpha-glucosyltransferase